MDKTAHKPEWLKVRAFSGQRFESVSRLLKQYHLNTVCQSANCPNRGECYNRGTATFLLLGPVCTRNCRFCDVRPGRPGAVDQEEPARVSEVAAQLNLKYVVLTSVTRDDLPDGGAGQFVRTVRMLRTRIPGVRVEILTPDFRDKPGAWDLVIDSRPDIFNHNVETVPRLYTTVRPQADYQLSLDLLRYVNNNSDVRTKSGLMVGLGETEKELIEIFRDLAHTGVSILTIGQYLSPSKEHLPVERYVHPDEFARFKSLAESEGIQTVFSAPLVRSSYMADQVAG